LIKQAKAILRQWTGWCVVFSRNVRARRDRSVQHYFFNGAIL